MRSGWWAYSLENWCESICFLTEPWLWNRLSFCRYNCCKFTTFRKQIDLKRIDSYIINKVKEQKKRSSAFYLEKTSYLCTCIRPTPLPLILWEKWAVKREGGSTTLWNASLTLCFWRFETTTLEKQVKNIAEVGAAGRYIPFPLVCRWLTMPSRTPFGTYYIYQRRGYHSVRLLAWLW